MQIISSGRDLQLPTITGWTPTLKLEAPEQGLAEYDGVNVGQMGEVVQRFKDAGINIRVTSGLRENAVTSSGRKSKHASGEAIDIVPINGETFDSMAQKVKSNPDLISWLQTNGYGILRETSDRALSKTGGSGFHWHIGTDKSAITDLRRIMTDKKALLGRCGLKITDKINEH